MDNASNVYPVLGRLRHGGKLYAPDSDLASVELTEKQAAPLLKIKTIGEPDVSFDLGERLSDLIEAGNDIADLNMTEIGKLLGRDGRGVKRKDVDAALERITNPPS